MPGLLLKAVSDAGHALDEANVAQGAAWHACDDAEGKLKRAIAAAIEAEQSDVQDAASLIDAFDAALAAKNAANTAGAAAVAAYQSARDELYEALRSA